MTQEGGIDALVGRRVRALRVIRRWTLDDLAERCHLSASTLSRMETGHRRIGLDQLTGVARALGTSIDHLVEPEDPQDVVIRPQHDERRGMTTWLLTRDQGPHGLRVARIRLTRPPGPHEDGELPIHPGRDWFTVVSGTVLLRLGERTIKVETGQAAEFSTMVPHAFGAAGAPAEIIAILDPDGERTHLPADHPCDAEDMTEHRRADAPSPPSRLRGGVAPPATTAIPDVPLATSRALDRLDRPELTALRIREALRVWQHVASLPHSTLSAPHSDWSEFVGPQARAELEEALSALSPRLARPLRRVIEQADEQFRAKTVNNPRAGTSDPWWARRWSH